VGFVVPLLASILMAIVLLNGEIFSKVTAYSGLVGFICLLIFTVWTTFIPTSFDTAMWLAMPGGLLVLVWNILITRRFFQLSHSEQEKAK